MKTKQLIEERPEDKNTPRKPPPTLTKDGREIPDPKPMAPPLGFIKQPSMIENIRNMIRSENLRQAALASGAETFDEADDFEVEDDDDRDPSSPYEANFDPLGEADRRALARRPVPLDDPELQALTGANERQPPSQGTDPVEGAAEGSPHTPSDAPAGLTQRVREHLRRKPEPK